MASWSACTRRQAPRPGRPGVRRTRRGRLPRQVARGSAPVTTVSQRLQAALLGPGARHRWSADCSSPRTRRAARCSSSRQPLHPHAVRAHQATLGAAPSARAAVWAASSSGPASTSTSPPSLIPCRPPSGAERPDRGAPPRLRAGSASANGRYAAAFVRGSRAAGHADRQALPGLGRVRSNTDFAASGITDGTTTATDPYLSPSATDRGRCPRRPSSARYTDRRRAPGHVLVHHHQQPAPGRLGFDGVVISDDVGAAGRSRPCRSASAPRASSPRAATSSSPPSPGRRAR